MIPISHQKTDKVPISERACVVRRVRGGGDRRREAQEDEDSFKQLLAMRQGPLLAMNKANEAIKGALADTGNEHPAATAITDLFIRKVAAIAAVPGLIAAICIFFASFFGLAMDKLGGKAFLLHLGILRGWELRLLASGWTISYFAMMMHWWFPRKDEWTVVMPD